MSGPRSPGAACGAPQPAVTRPVEFAGRRCLVTGGHGWLGRFLVDHLRRAGARVTVLDLPGSAPAGSGDFLAADLAAGPPDLPATAWDHIFHLAGLAHRVPRTREEAERFFRVNSEGTGHLLRALADRPPASLVLVSSVAVYGLERGEAIPEDTPRAARDPYGRSKVEAEDQVMEWAAARGVRAVVVRPPLVAGPGAPGNLGAMVRALRRGRYLRVGDGAARRSLVRADDLCAGLVALAAGGEWAYHLTDGRHPSFRELEDALAAALGRGPVRAAPSWLLRIAAAAGDRLDRVLRRDLPLDSRRLAKLTATLTFADDRARRDIGWAPRPVTAAAAWIAGRRPAPPGEAAPAG